MAPQIERVCARTSGRLGQLALMAVAALGVGACTNAIEAVPREARATRGLRVCWDSRNEGEDDAAFALKQAIGTRLAGAGYVLVPNRCDFRVSWTTKWQEHRDGAHPWYTRVGIVLRTPSGTFLDSLTLEYLQGQVPVEEPDRMAILMVNAINDSTRLAPGARDPIGPALQLLPAPSATSKE